MDSSCLLLRTRSVTQADLPQRCATINSLQVGARFSGNPQLLTGLHHRHNARA